MNAKAIMVLGTSSGAGKSWVATALCRHYARQGLRVMPFKAQNMSNNARVVAGPSGPGEIGSAQYFQALAARTEPDVRMNPLLLKPEADTRSQVVFMGQVNAALSALPWRERSAHVWPAIAQTLDEVRQSVLIDMHVNLGLSRLQGFRNTLALIGVGKYEAAAQEMLDSKWAEQVGRRAQRLSRMMSTGRW